VTPPPVYGWDDPNFWLRALEEGGVPLVVVLGIVACFKMWLARVPAESKPWVWRFEVAFAKDTLVQLAAIARRLQTGKRDVLLDVLAHLPQHVAQLDHPLELRVIAVRAKVRMVAVLLAAARVARRDLQMSFRDRTDPHVAPRGRNHQRAKATNVRALADDAAVRIDVREAPAGSAPADARLRVRHVSQPCRFRGSDELSRRPLAHRSSSTRPETAAPGAELRPDAA
jgi:hypothetical protein